MGIIKAILLIIIMLSGLYVLITFIDLFEVLVLNVEGYPFGAECAPWYYKTKEIYVRYFAVHGIIALLIILITGTGYLKFKNRVKK